MDPLTQMAIASVVTAGVGMMKQSESVRASNAAQKSGAKAEITGQKQRTLEGYRKKQEGTILGGSAETNAVSQQGKMLTGEQDKRSLVG